MTARTEKVGGRGNDKSTMQHTSNSAQMMLHWTVNWLAIAKGAGGNPGQKWEVSKMSIGAFPHGGWTATFFLFNRVSQRAVMRKQTNSHTP